MKLSHDVTLEMSHIVHFVAQIQIFLFIGALSLTKIWDPISYKNSNVKTFPEQVFLKIIYILHVMLVCVKARSHVAIAEF